VGTFMTTRRPWSNVAPDPSVLWLAIGGIYLLATHLVILLISPRFAYAELPVLQRPTGTFVTLMMLTGGVYLAMVWRLFRSPTLSRAGWLWIIVVGLGMRALMMPSTPILETDYFRYLWDGAVLAHGHNPYLHAPRDVLQGDAPAELIELGRASGLVLERINHPWLTTIYPPTAQVGFAVGYFIMPWRIEGLRLAWLLLDLVTLGLLIGLLRQLAMPLSFPGAVLIYWWNPLLIKEGYNTAHMEMTLLPFVAAALWLAVRYRLLAGCVALALAVGAKLWPVLLLPALLRQSGMRRSRVAIAAAVFAILCAMIVSPMLLSYFGETAGVRAYATSWQVNASLYQGFHLLGGWLTPDDPHRAARLMVAGIVLVWIGWLCRRPAAEGKQVCERALWIVAALFLLSPTQLPWYWLWMLPMLVVRPSPGLLLLTATLPLYYVRFPLRELGYSNWFNHGVVWLQFGPSLLLLAWEAWRRLADATVHESRLAGTRPSHPERAEVRP
jgi:alpha-1,6-mannosyltransferase